jgi:hypothetical protein
MLDEMEIKDFGNMGAVPAVEKIAGKFKMGGNVFEVRALKDSNIAYLIAAVNENGDPMRTVSKVLNFMERALTDESYPRFEAYVLDPKAGLEIKEILQVFQHVLVLVASGGGPDEPESKTTTRKPRAAR